jgi:hypothetical protein
MSPTAKVSSDAASAGMDASDRQPVACVKAQPVSAAAAFTDAAGSGKSHGADSFWPRSGHILVRNIRHVEFCPQGR